MCVVNVASALCSTATATADLLLRLTSWTHAIEALSASPTNQFCLVGPPEPRYLAHGAFAGPWRELDPSHLHTSVPLVSHAGARSYQSEVLGSCLVLWRHRQQQRQLQQTERDKNPKTGTATTTGDDRDNSNPCQLHGTDNTATTRKNAAQTSAQNEVIVDFLTSKIKGQ